MKKVVLIIICLISIPKMHSQKVGEIIGAAVGAAAIAAIEIEQYQERWELFATNHILTNYDFDAFELKIDGFDKTKALDPSTVSILAFNISPINYEDGIKQDEDKFTLLVILDDGYMNQFGIDVTKIRYEKFDKERWNKLYMSYLELASKTSLDDPMRIPVFSDDIRQQKQDDTEYKPIVVPASMKMYKFTGNYTNVAATRISNKGLSFKNDVYLPFSYVNGDSYYVKDYDEKFKIIYNERSMGLYIKELGKLFQLRNKFVSEITSYLNN